MIVLDTTLLVYAVGDRHGPREPASALLAAIGRGALTATTTIEVIQEFTHVRARRRGRSDASALARDLATLLTPLTPATAVDLDLGLTLYGRHAEPGCFDAVLAAVTRRLGARLVSADRAFTEALGADHLDLVTAPERLLAGPRGSGHEPGLS